MKVAVHRAQVAAKSKNMEIKMAINHRESIIALLTAERLPVNDLPETLDHFMVALNDDKIIGAAGLEIYGDYGLLRSLAVNAAFRNQGIAGKLVRQIETQAGSKALKAIYLLTETAPDYFDRKGYARVNRDDVPAEVQRSSEFNHVCPQSAIVMKKIL